MPGYLTADELVAVVDTEAGHLADEAERVLLSDPVPTCPDWTVADLIGHLGGTHRWATAIVSRALQQNLPADEEAALLEAPADPADLLPWFRAGAERAGRRAANPRRQTCRRSSFSVTRRRPGSSGPDGRPTRPPFIGWTCWLPGWAGFRRPRRPPSRRSWRSTASTNWSADFVPRRSSRLRTTEPFVMVISPTDATASWTVAVSDQPPVVSAGADPNAQSLISGTSAALYLGLWNRGDDIAENGTVDALGHWREQVRIAWS